MRKELGQLTRRNFLTVATLLGGYLGYQFLRRWGMIPADDVWSIEPPQLDPSVINLLILADIHAGYTNKPHQANTLALPVLEEIISYRPGFEIRLDLGDTVRHEIKSAENIALYRSVLNVLNLPPDPTLHLLGNHDTRGITSDELDELNQINTLNPWYGLKDYDDFQIVWLNINTTKHEFGELPGPTVDWLEQILARKHSFIFSHPALIPHSIKGMHYFLNDSDTAYANGPDVWQRIKHHNIIAVISGHSHKWQVRNIDGIPHLSLPSLVEKYNLPGIVGAYATMHINHPESWNVAAYMGYHRLSNFTWPPSDNAFRDPTS